jgi:hypothetical protein
VYALGNDPVLSDLIARLFTRLALCCGDKGGEAFKASKLAIASAVPDASLPRHADNVVALHACPLARMAALDFLHMCGCVCIDTEPNKGKFMPAWKLNPHPRWTRMKYSPVRPDLRDEYHIAHLHVIDCG